MIESETAQGRENALTATYLRPPPLPSHRAPVEAPPVAADSLPPEPAPPPIANPAVADSTTSAPHNPVKLRRWWLEELRETPSWLASMVTHLAVLLIVGSLAMPPGNFSTLNAWFVVGTADNDLLAEADLLDNPIEEIELEEAAEFKLDAPLPPPTPMIVEQAMAPPSLLDLPLIAPPPVAGSESLASHYPSQDGDPSESKNRLPVYLASAVKGDGAGAELSDVPPGSDGSGPSAQAGEDFRSDLVVERFIQYDIGRLRGAAGDQARREFEALGPYAIPSLVRGLNRSASIQASCPVVVLSAKLENALAQSGDYEMIRYAVDNIGRDVPENAPHLARLLALSDALRRMHLDRDEAIRDELAAMGVDASDELRKQVVGYSQGTPAELLAALRSTDPQTRLAATMAAGRLGSSLTDGQRSLLARELVGQLSDESEAIGRMSHAALTALIWNASSAEADAAGDRETLWRSRLESFDRSNRLERTARSIFTTGRTRERRGDISGAAERYRRVVEEFPGTEASAEAAERLEVIGA